MADDDLAYLTESILAQAGIALAVAQCVYHHNDTTLTPMFSVSEIAAHLRRYKTIVIVDDSFVLNCGLAARGAGRKRVQRGDYLQAVLLLGTQTVDVMRQVQADERHARGHHQNPAEFGAQ